MNEKMFQRNIEDFVCEYCGEKIIGNGYTNHCPHCLYSKHVDVFPGDREATCGGLMAPFQVEQTLGGYQLTHQCLVCGHTKNNKTALEDSFEAIVAIAKKKASNL